MKARRVECLLGILLLSSLAACHHKEQQASSQKLPTAEVRVQIVEAKPRLATEEVIGTVRPKLRAAIEAKVSARIEQMLAIPGRTVRSGDLLVQLDAREIQARLEQSLALREQYARETERLHRLLTDNAVSRQEFETVESRSRVAAAAVSEGETMLGYARIVAPFDGVVTRKLADVGDLATPGRALLEMDDPNSLRLEAEVPEALINRMELGANFEVHVAPERASIACPVSEIAPVADSASRTFTVKLDLPATAGLRAGQFARVTVPVAESKGLRLPASAVVQRGQMELVFVVTNQQSQLRLVKTGKRTGEELEIVSGVEAGELVVVEGATHLRDGQPVQVRP